MNNSELEQQIIEDYKALGGVVKYVADKHKMNSGTVKKILIKNNIEVKNPRLVMTDELENKIRLLIEDGLSYPQISQQLDLGYGTVKKFCHEHSLVSKKHGCSNTYTEEEIRTIKELALRGMTSTGISKKTPFSRDAITNFCKKEGIALRYEKKFKVADKDLKTEMLALGYDFISIEKDVVKAKHIICGHIRETIYRDYPHHGCPKCTNNGVSKGELEVLDWVRSLGFEASSKRFKFEYGSRPYQVDIFIPSLNLGIEYCGLYWHSGKPRFYHQNKTQSCEKLGVRLITIFEDEWKSRQGQVKNFLKSVMKITEKVIYARKCKVSQIDLHVAKKFLDSSHIQGSSPSQVAFGLEYEGELVGVMTGNKHHRVNDRSIFVLNRMAFKDGFSIIGGASKLLKHLVKYCQDNNYTKLISWSDNRWSQGNVYSKLGFVLEEDMEADYSYVDKQVTKVRISKQTCVKKNLIAKGGVGNTERELATSLGLERIYDCGKKRWIKTI